MKSIVDSSRSCNWASLLGRTITGEKWRGMILKSARKSSDAQAWGFENGVLLRRCGPVSTDFYGGRLLHVSKWLAELLFVSPPIFTLRFSAFSAM